jgi:hypothetical protein
VELDAHQDNMLVGYVNGGTMAMNAMELADETSTPPSQFAISR